MEKYNLLKIGNGKSNQQCKVTYVTLRYVPKLSIPSYKTRINNSRLPRVLFQELENQKCHGKNSPFIFNIG